MGGRGAALSSAPGQLGRESLQEAQAEASQATLTQQPGGLSPTPTAAHEEGQEEKPGGLRRTVMDII